MEDKVIDVDRMEGGVIVTFMDGVVVRYSASLLRQMISHAEVLPREDESEPVD